MIPADTSASADRLSEATVRVAIVDDHESVLLGLRAACLEAGYEVVAVGLTVPDLLRALGTRPSDVVVLDLSIGDGLSVTHNVEAALRTGASVLVHSIADRTASVREALAAGAAGVIPKSASTSTVIAAIATVAAGGC